MKLNCNCCPAPYNSKSGWDILIVIESVIDLSLVFKALAAVFQLYLGDEYEMDDAMNI